MKIPFNALTIVAFVLSGYPSVAQAALPQKREFQPVEPQKATRNFHTFMTCVARKNPEKVANWILSEAWDETYPEIVELVKHSRCLRGTSDHKFDASETQIKGVFAEGLFELQMHEKEVYPSFIEIEPLINAEQIKAAKNSDTKSRLIVAAFSECVVRNSTDNVLGLLSSKPTSSTEQSYFSTMSSTMSICLPQNDGTEIVFSKSILRSNFALAAYKLFEIQTDPQRVGSSSFGRPLSEAKN